MRTTACCQKHSRLQISSWSLDEKYCSFGICPSLVLFRLCFVSLPQPSEAIRLTLPLKDLNYMLGRFCYCLEDVVSLWALLFHLVHKLVFHVSVITILYYYGSFNWLKAIIFFYKIEPFLHWKGITSIYLSRRVRIVQFIPNTNLLTQNHVHTIAVFTEVPIRARENQDCKAVTLILSSKAWISFMLCHRLSVRPWTSRLRYWPQVSPRMIPYFLIALTKQSGVCVSWLSTAVTLVFF